ncbi:hypothetical protein [Streptomyces olivochromogenes]|uniref:Uncharacterized protein n=1 Tax=Streptomyces olivochromogenes TaxID=1963 RepID=A0A250VN23_STROL|nr:hypothetical protein [Streptomyces olivochromogenes]GAX55370.1 hypothetical protein SO3561_06926 [Streptomyces olivochromogenes]
MHDAARPTKQGHRPVPRTAPRHRLARSAGHLFGYALLGYIVVHQWRSLKNPAA